MHKTNQYEFLFNVKTGKPYQAMRGHFMSLDQEANMDLVSNVIDQILVYAREGGGDNVSRADHKTSCLAFIVA
ncbi:hypothetical protein PIB30_072172 [Stylosanthes scabra]|uniref:Uncharacterized protein n=1 Tax=Stylosanthes scabra TaxID=79078 RepID=A0ABU6XPV1_9FABA|nr:hypothetical protein [Stylosanthes scabra]